MKHQELLDKLAYTPHTDPNGKYMYRALRAVVKLHKPVEEDGKLWCSHEECYNHIEFLERNDCYCSYPCPTIQAIEKELE